MVDKTELLWMQRLDKAKELLAKCNSLENTIEGRQKLKRKIQAELRFLQSLTSSTAPLKDSHIKSTNLSFLEAVFLTVESEKDVSAVFKPFCFSPADSLKPGSVLVDVVASHGCRWIKVTARNAVALHRTWQVLTFSATALISLLLLGQGDFGNKGIVIQTEELQDASRQHPINYVPPLIVLSCFNGITESMANALKKAGVCLKAKILPDPGNEALIEEVDTTVTSEIQIHNGDYKMKSHQCCLVNLDVTTLIAYVSALTNGGCKFIFKEAILTQQAKQEQKDPVLPKLKTFLEGKQLFACQSAVRDFNAILKTVGGCKERWRAQEFLKNITVVDDNPSSRSMALQPTANVKERPKIIFGTGDSLKAITATANVAFTRAAVSQGVEFSVFIHESRALTEAKESQATPMATVPDVI